MILLLDRLVFSLMKEQFRELNSDILGKAFGEQLPDKEFYDIMNYFSKNKPEVKFGFSPEVAKVPSVFVMGVGTNLFSSLVGEEQGFEDLNTIGTKHNTMVLAKTVRIVPVADNYLIMSCLTGLIVYFLLQNRNALAKEGADLAIYDVTEVDFLQKYLPNTLFSSTVRATFKVEDTVDVSDHYIIKKVTVENNLFK